MARREPMPLTDALITPKDGRLRGPWINWFSQLNTDVAATPRRERTVTLAAQSAAIAPTVFPIGAVAAGLYRVTYFVRVTTPAGVSSSVGVQFGFTSGGIAMFTPATPLTGNTVGSNDSRTFLIDVDANTAITYTTTYASSGAPAMAYALRLSLETVDA